MHQRDRAHASLTVEEGIADPLQVGCPGAGKVTHLQIEETRDHLQVVLHAVVDLVHEDLFVFQRCVELARSAAYALLQLEVESRHHLVRVLERRDVDAGSDVTLELRSKTRHP